MEVQKKIQTAIQAYDAKRKLDETKKPKGLRAGKLEILAVGAGVMVMIFEGMLWWQTGRGVYTTQRAYMFVTGTVFAQNGFPIVPPPDNQRMQPAVNVTFTNTGQTPALDVRVRAGVFIQRPDQQITEAMLAPIFTNFARIGAIGKDKALGFHVERNEPSVGRDPATEYALTVGPKRDFVIRVAGRVTYKDIFETTNEMDFCQQWVIDDDGWHACNFFNDFRTLRDLWHWW
jgi:hypothetical protein